MFYLKFTTAYKNQFLHTHVQGRLFGEDNRVPFLKFLPNSKKSWIPISWGMSCVPLLFRSKNFWPKPQHRYNVSTQGFRTNQCVCRKRWSYYPAMINFTYVTTKLGQTSVVFFIFIYGKIYVITWHYLWVCLLIEFAWYFYIFIWLNTVWQMDRHKYWFSSHSPFKNKLSRNEDDFVFTRNFVTKWVDPTKI